jgi:hypothetical protein
MDDDQELPRDLPSEYRRDDDADLNYHKPHFPAMSFRAMLARQLSALSGQNLRWQGVEGMFFGRYLYFGRNPIAAAPYSAGDVAEPGNPERHEDRRW